MALTYLDRVKETSTTSGTGAYALAGAVQGFRAFSAVGNGNTCYYAVTDGNDWEVGLGAYNSGTNTLARTAILASSNAGAAVGWGGGTRSIWLDAPAEYLVRQDGVATRTVLKALYPSPGMSVWLYEAGRAGRFVWTVGDYSAQVAADTSEGVYLQASAIAASSGAWVRVYTGPVAAEWFGAVGDGTTDDATAINAALGLAGANGKVLLGNKTYAIGSRINLYLGQMLEGVAPAGSVFTAAIATGTWLKWIGATSSTMMVVGANPSITTGQVKPWGGGLRNLQFYALVADNQLRLTSVDNAVFENLKFVNFRDSSSASCILAVPNATEGGFDNTVRNCRFDGITMFSWGAGHGFRNFNNGTDGGITGSTFRNCYCEYGGNTGSGNGFYFSSMDDCDFTALFAGRLAGGSGVSIYFDANGGTKQVSGNTFRLVHVSGGPIFCDGATAQQNYMYGITGVDEKPVILLTNGARLYYDYLGGPFGSPDTAFSIAPPTQLESVLLTDFTGSNVSTAQPVFSSSQDEVALQGDSTYEFEAEYFITRAAGTTSHTTGVLFGGTATFDAVGYLAQVTNPIGNALANVQQIWVAAATLVTLTAANTSATENLIIMLKGRIRTNAAGTLIPQFQYSAAPGGAPTVKANSAFKIWQIGTDQVVSFGPWS